MASIKRQGIRAIESECDKLFSLDVMIFRTFLTRKRHYKRSGNVMIGKTRQPQNKLVLITNQMLYQLSYASRIM